MRKGKTLELGLFAASWVLLIITGYLFMKSRDSDFREAKNSAEYAMQRAAHSEKLSSQFETRIAALETIQSELAERMVGQVQQMANMAAKQSENTSKPVTVKLSEPINVRVVYKPIPAAPTPLLKKSGVTKQKFQ